MTDEMKAQIEAAQKILDETHPAMFGTGKRIAALIGQRDEALIAESKAIAELARVIEERDAAVADAERYRYIRQHVHGENYGLTSQCFVFDWPTPLSNIMHGSVAQHLDAAIDAAKEEA